MTYYTTKQYFLLKALCYLLFAYLTSVLSVVAQPPVIVQNTNIVDIKSSQTFVIDGTGQLLAVDTLLSETPEEVVQRQLNAYNARDIDAFLDTYADSIELYSFPNQLTTKGKEDMRTRYARLFENTPNLYAEIKNRIVIGNKVIDQEYVRVGERYINAVAIYEVADGTIVRVTFVRG